jgi:hypothetical protein
MEKIYNEKFKQFLYFYWFQQFVVPHSKIERPKHHKFQIMHNNCTLGFTPTSCTTMRNVNLT